MTETKLDERLISGVGILRIPTPGDIPRYFSIIVNVVRDPIPIFQSKKYSPFRQRYATMTYLRDGYVLSEMAIDYPQRRFDEVLDICGQTLLAVKCSYQGILQSFVNLGSAAGLSVVSVTDQIKIFTSLNMFADEVHFVCEGSAALQVILMYDKYDTCNPESVQQKKPPPPPPPLSKVPPTTPIGSISPPYDANDKTTSPYPGDTSVPPQPQLPYGNADTPYTISFDWDRQIPIGTFSDTQHASFSIYGPITDYGLTQDASNLPPSGQHSGWGAYVVGHSFQGLVISSTQTFGYPGSGAAVNMRNINITP